MPRDGDVAVEEEDVGEDDMPAADSSSGRGNGSVNMFSLQDLLLEVEEREEPVNVDDDTKKKRTVIVMMTLLTLMQIFFLQMVSLDLLLLLGNIALF